MIEKILLSVFNFYCRLPMQKVLEGTTLWHLGTKFQELWAGSHVPPHGVMGVLQSSTLSYGYWDLERIVNRGDLNGLRTRISSFLLFWGFNAEYCYTMGNGMGMGKNDS